MTKVYTAQTIYNFLTAMEHIIETTSQAMNLDKPFPAGYFCGYNAAIKTLVLVFAGEPPPVEVCRLEEIGDETKA